MGGFKQALVDFLLPVGSYYFTENSGLSTTSAMHDRFGGTWVKLSDEVIYAVAESSTDVGRTEGSNNPEVPLKNHTHVLNPQNYFLRAKKSAGASEWGGSGSSNKWAYCMPSSSDWELRTINVNAAGDGDAPTIDVRGQRRRCYGYRRTA